MKTKILFVVSILLILSIGFVVSANSILNAGKSMGGDDISSENIVDDTKKLVLADLCKKKVDLSTAEDFVEFVYQTMELYEEYDYIEITDNAWLREFDKMHRDQGEYLEKLDLSQDEYDEYIETRGGRLIDGFYVIDTSRFDETKYNSRDDYKNYLEDVYRLILARLFYTLPRENLIDLFPFRVDRNLVPTVTYAYVSGYDTNKYTAEEFHNKYRYSIINDEPFESDGIYFIFSCSCMFVRNVENNKMIFPSESQSELLQSFNK